MDCKINTSLDEDQVIKVNILTLTLTDITMKLPQLITYIKTTIFLYCKYKKWNV